MDGVSSVMANNFVITVDASVLHLELSSMHDCVRKIMEGGISI